MTIRDLISILFVISLFQSLGCSSNDPDPQVSSGDHLEDTQQINATDVKVSVNNKPLGQSTVNFELGKRSELVIRFRLPEHVSKLDNIPDASLKAIRTKKDGTEITQTSTRGPLVKQDDGTYEVVFDIQRFSKPMEMKLRVQSGLKRVPYVIGRFDAIVN